MTFWRKIESFCLYFFASILIHLLFFAAEIVDKIIKSDVGPSSILSVLSVVFEKCSSKSFLTIRSVLPQSFLPFHKGGKELSIKCFIIFNILLKSVMHSFSVCKVFVKERLIVICWWNWEQVYYSVMGVVLIPLGKIT